MGAGKFDISREKYKALITQGAGISVTEMFLRFKVYKSNDTN
jgi:hypothetical protein